MSSRFAAALALVLLALGASGCARVEKALTPEPEVVTIEATIAVPAADVNGDLAAGLPEGVPLWPGAEVRRSKASDAAYTLTLAAQEAFDDVVAGLAAGFEKAGYEVLAEDLEATGDESGRSTALTVSGLAAEGIITVTEGDSGIVTMAYVLSAVE